MQQLFESIDRGPLENHLAATGWNMTQVGDWQWKQKGRAPVTLNHSQQGDWAFWQLTMRRRGNDSAKAILDQNALMYGPIKRVHSETGQAHFRLDCREEDGSNPANEFHPSSPNLGCGSVDAYIAAIDCSVRDTQPPATPHFEADQLVGSIKQLGRTVSVEDGQVVIHLQLPAIYRQVIIGTSAIQGVSLSTDLIDYSGLASPCRRAMELLAIGANTRLPLVRFANSHESPTEALRAEVNLGCAQVPCALLTTAIQVIEQAVALTARELEALRDPELAELVLAHHKAGLSSHQENAR